MPKKKSYTPQEVIDAINKADGYVSKAASLLKCSTQTVYNYRNEHPEVAKAWDDIRESRHDFVENKLHGAIDEGNVTAMIFYLKTQAKDRGYVERQELQHDGELNIRIVFDD